MIEKPGFYSDMPMEEYIALDAVNNGALTALATRSPAYCKQQQEEHRPPTPAERIGTAVHAAILEPERFAQDYIEWKMNRRSSRGKAAWQAICDAGQIPLKPEELALVRGIAESVMSHPVAKPMLDHAVAVEETTLWRREGRLCKSRKDIRGDGYLADIKTTRDLRGFSPGVITHYGYYRQAAWYLEGDAALGVVHDSWRFIAVHNTPPFECAVFELEPAYIEAGSAECAQLFEKYLECEKAGQWPRHLLGIQPARITQSRWDEIFERQFADG